MLYEVITVGVDGEPFIPVQFGRFVKDLVRYPQFTQIVQEP